MKDEFTKKWIISNSVDIVQEELYNKAVLAAEEADKSVKKIEAKKLEMIKSAKLPEGLAFTEDGISIDGLPVSREQLSSSKLYITALKLASMSLGKVQTLHFDASFLDKNSLEEIENWAKENDLQLLIERPDFDGGEITYQILQPNE